MTSSGCPPEEVLARAVELEEEDPCWPEIERHIDVCPRCRNLADQYRELTRLVRSQEDTHVDPALQRKLVDLGGLIVPRGRARATRLIKVVGLTTGFLFAALVVGWAVFTRGEGVMTILLTGVRASVLRRLCEPLPLAATLVSLFLLTSGTLLLCRPGMVPGGLSAYWSPSRRT